MRTSTVRLAALTRPGHHAGGDRDRRRLPGRAGPERLHEHPAGPRRAHRAPACQDVPVIDQDAEKNTTIDPEHGLLLVKFRDLTGAEQTVTVDYLDDQSCLRLPGLREVVADAIVTWRDSNNQECVSLRALFNSGATEVRGKPIDHDALGRHIGQWCPSP